MWHGTMLRYQTVVGLVGLAKCLERNKDIYFEVLRIAASVVDEVHILGNLRWWQFWLEGQGATCWWERMSREVGSQGGEETAAGRGELRFSIRLTWWAPYNSSLVLQTSIWSTLSVKVVGGLGRL